MIGKSDKKDNPNFWQVRFVKWKVIPAGISKKTGNRYLSFRVCSVENCDQKPPKGLKANEFLDSLGTLEPVKDRLIVRQNVLSHATKLVSTGVYAAENPVLAVMEIAEILEAWVYREDKEPDERQ